MAWINITASAGNWLTALESSAGAVVAAVESDRALLGIYYVGTANPPYLRYTWSVDVVTRKEYRGLNRSSASAAVVDGSLNTLVVDQYGRQTLRRRAVARRMNEGDGWIVETTETATSYQVQEVPT